MGSNALLFKEVVQMHDKIVKIHSNKAALQLKWSAGGLMTGEFIIQALQMRHGIWETNTLKALEKLENYQILPNQEANTLRNAYLFQKQCQTT